MKTLKLFALLLIIALTSCKSDLCQDISCLNGGTCLNGLCSCPIGFEGNFCERERIPRIISIYSIEIVEFPQTRFNGTGWDPSNGPDIYPLIYNTRNKTVLYKHPTYINNAVIGGTPYSFLVNPNYRITDVTVGLLMQIFDYEDFSSDELMTQVVFIPHESGKGFPNPIEIGSKGSGSYIKLYVSYEF